MVACNTVQKTGTMETDEDRSGGSGRKVIPVRVAVRVRPVVQREMREFYSSSLEVSPNHPQVTIRGSDSNRAFTFDFVFPPESGQEEIYNKAVSKVVHELYHGFNVTVLAYGQTGSGKTYSMGTNYVLGSDLEEMGIIPRAVMDIFETIRVKTEDEFVVTASFIELYGENLYDLLKIGPREDCIVEIRETITGDIKLQGVTDVPVSTLEETMKCLEKGSLNRATGATAMNATSSRSHAIFCLQLEHRKKGSSDDVTVARFTMVDLAGSERAKKTGATGVRFKEGVFINQGLLALGNVISILAAPTPHGKEKYVPYRVSKLTRLLQDSLGGNSHTVMLACVSPADDSLEETLNTLRYADRARQIKNKPVVNSDPKAAELTKLKQQIQQLQVQLITSQATGGGVATHTAEEMSCLVQQNSQLKDENDSIMRALQAALDENTNMAEKALMAEMAHDRLKQRLQELRAQTGDTVDNMNKTLSTSGCDAASTTLVLGQLNLVKDLQRKVIDLQAEQSRGEKALRTHELTRHNACTTNTSFGTSSSMDDTGDSSVGDTADNAAADGNEAVGAVGVEEEEDDEDVAASVASPSHAFNVAYTLRQSKLNDELANLNRALAQKEQLMGQMVDNDDTIKTMRSNYEKAIMQLEGQIDVIVKEKEHLQSQLEKTPKNAVNKISEQRRLRLQELSLQIDSLKHKVLEKNKLLKMKESTERKVNVLSTEISGMKQTRVKLVRQMKEDSEKFRQWKSQKNREIAKLKEQDRRKEFQIVKMERLNSKQQNVLKRKIEEGSAINKRLKDALAVQKACAEKRANSRGADAGNLQSRVKSWLDGEIDVVAVKIQAKHSLKSLREDRKTISDQLQKVEHDLKESDLSVEFQQELQSKKDELENELQLRTAQITDIQQKCLDDGGDTAAELVNRKRFESIQNMAEAKAALSHLFESASQHKAASATHRHDIADVQSQYAELVRSMEDTEVELEALRTQHKRDINKLSHDHEDKVLYLLRQLAGSEETDNLNTSANSSGGSQKSSTSSVSLSEHNQLKQKLSFQEAEIRRLSELHQELQRKIEECDDLQKQLEEERNTKPSPSAISLLASQHLSSALLPKPKPKVKVSLVTSDDESEEVDEFDSGDEDDDDQIDPDWRKTPLFKRIRSMKSRSKMEEAMNSSEEDKENMKTGDLFGRMSMGMGMGVGIKRTSDGGPKCGCNSDCLSKRCVCRKSGGVCSVACKCNAMKCANKTPGDAMSCNSSADSSKDALLNSTFDVGGHTAAAADAKRPRLSRPEDNSLSSTTAVDGSNNSSLRGGNSSSSLRDVNITFLKPT